jgi:hypothetical protein
MPDRGSRTGVSAAVAASWPGAAQTAMGVAGGLLLGNAIAGMLSGGGEAQAADAGADDPQAEDARWRRRFRPDDLE